MDQGPEQTGSGWGARWPWVGLALILTVATALRLGYFLNGDPFVDEWASMLAAQGIWKRGLPVLPSGAFYGHGMLFSYVDALFLALLGWTPTVAQLPSLIAGLATIPLIYIVGRELFAPPRAARLAPVGTGEQILGNGVPPAPDRQVTSHAAELSRLRTGPAGEPTWRWRGEAAGLLAAALLALDPIAILWGGRARGYTLQQLFVLLAILAAFRRRYLLLALAFVCALFSHEEAALLLPGFAVGLLLMQGRYTLRQPRFWLAMGISGMAVIARLWLHRFMLMGSGAGFQPIDSRPAFQPSLDIVAGFKPLLPYFTEPYRLAVTALFVVGLAFAVRAWRRRERDSGYLLLYPVCLVTLAGMLTIVGQTWKDPRYLFMLLPAFFILATAAAVDLWQFFGSRSSLPAWLQAAAGGLLALVLLIPPVPEALDTADKLEEGYGPTLAYVRAHWQPGDQVAGWAVPAIAVELGQIDYFAIQIRHEEFIMEKNGVWVDRWVGAPLMDSVEQLQAALDEPGRLWFLTDEFRFRARYAPEFAQAIWDRMEPVYRYHYALAFLEYPPDQPAYRRDLQISFEDGLDLVGYDLEPATLQPGETVTVTLHWQAREPVSTPYTVFLHLLDPKGQRVDQADGPPFDGLHPTDHWLPGEHLRDHRHLTLPAEAMPGRYQLVVGWYDPLTQDRLRVVNGEDSLSLASIPLGPIEVDEASTPIHATLGDKVELVGFDLWRDATGQWVPVAEGEELQTGDRLKVRLVWRALAEMEPNYTAFVHLEGPGGEVWGQHDGQPAAGSYPTSHWRPGDFVADEHEFVVISAAAGPAQLLAGMYQLETMERLGEAVVLRQVNVAAGAGSETTP